MNRKVLLVADDDEMNRTVISRFLGTEFDILESRDGKETLACLNASHVDALLLDIIMPELDGLQVLQALAQEKRNPYLGVLVATSTKERTERQALALGADDVVSKPYDPIVISKRLHNILAIKDAQREKALLEQGAEAAAPVWRQRAWSDAEASVKKLHSIAKIINCNRDNPRLLAEMAESIHKEADKLSALFSETV